MSKAVSRFALITYQDFCFKAVLSLFVIFNVLYTHLIAIICKSGFELNAVLVKLIVSLIIFFLN